MAIVKNVVRFAVIAGLVGGTAVVIAGPERVGALFTQTREVVTDAIDAQISDPVALRSQIKSLVGEYPRRIAEVRGDLAQLKEQQSQLTREQSISERVVALASADLEQIQGLIARGEAAQGGGQVVRVVFNNEGIDLKDCYAKANRIRQVHNSYASRGADIQRDLAYIGQQEQRLTGLLSQLEAEHTDFQTQVWNLDRQVDTIARNDRLITLMEKRQRTIDEQSRYSAGSLDQLATRFADIRAKQEARLESLGTQGSTMNYEDRAKLELDARASYQSKSLMQPAIRPIRPEVIEIRPEDGATTPAPATPPAPAPAKDAASVAINR